MDNRPIENKMLTAIGRQMSKGHPLDPFEPNDRTDFIERCGATVLSGFGLGCTGVVESRCSLPANHSGRCQ